MDLSIDIKTLGFILIVIALLVLIIYLILLVRKLLVTIDHANKVLSDAEIVSEIVAERSQDVDSIIGDVSETAKSVAAAGKDKKGVVSATTTAVKAAVGVKNVVSSKKEAQKEAQKESRKESKKQKK